MTEPISKPELMKGRKVLNAEKISVVVPVHNEEKYLPYCIAGLVQSPIHEAIFVLDRCFDRSLEIVKNVNFPFKVRVAEIRKKQWKSPTAEPVAKGCREAEGDVVYCIGCDMYVDPKIFMIDWEGIDVCSFNLKAYSLFGNLRSMIMAKIREFVIYNYEKMKSRMVHRRAGTGLYGFRRSIYQDIRHIDCDAEDSYLLNTSMQKGYRHRYFAGTKCLHLRPDNPRSYKFRAQLAASNYDITLPRAVFGALKYVSPTYLREYLTTRASRPNPTRRRTMS
jgi:glycosyltransferase involved in cell wall biosynthesis